MPVKTMYKFIKGLLKQQEPEKRILAFDAVRGSMTMRNPPVSRKLKRSADKEYQECHGWLQHIVNGIADAERVGNPSKLKSIAKFTSPVRKGIDASLSGTRKILKDSMLRPRNV
jgi:hypothetical protein